MKCKQKMTLTGKGMITFHFFFLSLKKRGLIQYLVDKPQLERPKWRGEKS